MKRLSQLKLNQLNNAELNERELSRLLGGSCDCGCACAYANSGGPSSVTIVGTNKNGNLYSPQGPGSSDVNYSGNQCIYL